MHQEPIWAPTERHATVVQYAGDPSQKGVKLFYNLVLIDPFDPVHCNRLTKLQCMNKHPYLSGKISPQLEDCLTRFRIIPTGNTPGEVYHSLARLNEAHSEAPAALAVDNPPQSGMLFLLDQPHPLFYLGFDPEGNNTSKGVFPKAHTQGNNHALLHDALVVVFKSFAEAITISKAVNHKNLQP